MSLTMQEVLWNGLHARAVTGRLQRSCAGCTAGTSTVSAGVSNGGDGDDDFAWVCVTHARFVPCRGGTNKCVLSCTREALEAVRRERRADPTRFHEDPT